jgi:hypothetical protein
MHLLMLGCPQPSGSGEKPRVFGATPSGHAMEAFAEHSWILLINTRS